MTITLHNPVPVDQLETAATPPAPLTSLDVETLVQMGYTPITVLPQSDLLAILREHEIMVYLPQDIKTYKEQMIRSATRRANKWIPIGALAAVTQIATGFLTMLGNHEWLPIVLWVTGGVTGIGTALYTLGTVPPEATWTNQFIRHYREEIPSTVLATMARLRRANASLEFEVETLHVKPREVDQYGIFDPLLSVSLRGAKYCIAVWDEPKFTAKPRH